MKPMTERIKETEDKLKQLRAQQQKIEAQTRAASIKKMRAEETRRKVLIGAMILDRMQKDDQLKAKISSQLDHWLTRNDDRRLFELPESCSTGIEEAMNV